MRQDCTTCILKALVGLSSSQATSKFHGVPMRTVVTVNVTLGILQKFMPQLHLDISVAVVPSSAAMLPGVCLANCYFGRHRALNNVTCLVLMSRLSVSTWMLLILKAPRLR